MFEQKLQFVDRRHMVLAWAPDRVVAEVLQTDPASVMKHAPDRTAALNAFSGYIEENDPVYSRAIHFAAWTSILLGLVLEYKRAMAINPAQAPAHKQVLMSNLDALASLRETYKDDPTNMDAYRLKLSIESLEAAQDDQTMFDVISKQVEYLAKFEHMLCLASASHFLGKAQASRNRLIASFELLQDRITTKTSTSITTCISPKIMKSHADLIALAGMLKKIEHACDDFQSSHILPKFLSMEDNYKYKDYAKVLGKTSGITVNRVAIAFAAMAVMALAAAGIGMGVDHSHFARKASLLVIIALVSFMFAGAFKGLSALGGGMHGENAKVGSYHLMLAKKPEEVNSGKRAEAVKTLTTYAYDVKPNKASKSTEMLKPKPATPAQPAQSVV